MLKTIASKVRYIALMTALIAIPAMSGQQPKATVAAPVPPQIASARKVFISNDGADDGAEAIFKRAGEPDQAYNHFYAAIQNWGRYELVPTPAEADLVFEIRFTAPMYYNGTLAVFDPQFGLRIVDAKTHFVLWNLTEPVNGAFRESTWVKNFDQGLDLLMADMKKISAPSMSTPEPLKK
jgi:hypothetical protein